MSTHRARFCAPIRRRRAFRPRAVSHRLSLLRPFNLSRPINQVGPFFLTRSSFYLDSSAAPSPIPGSLLGFSLLVNFHFLCASSWWHSISLQHLSRFVPSFSWLFPLFFFSRSSPRETTLFRFISSSASPIYFESCHS